MIRSPPLRFLAVVLGGWAAIRTAILAPPWSTPAADAASVEPTRRIETVRAGPGPTLAPLSEATAPAARLWVGVLPVPVDRPLVPDSQPALANRAAPTPVAAATGIEAPGVVAARASVSMLSPPNLPTTRAPPVAGRRWSLSAWSFLRRGEAAPLAAGGLLGGSQAGARLLYRVNGDAVRPLALSVRLSTPLGRASGAEAAFGADWRPARRVPLHLLVERRQAIGAEGRSAFGITLHGGVDEAPLGRFRIDVYAQAGIVGLRSRDPFADGALRVSLPLGDRARLGAGAWAAAQPGASRLDFGPQASLRLPVAGRAVTLAADWRLRVAGNAKPGSGPTVTVGMDF